ncbi:chemotaxis protein CheD [Pseudoduganella sp. RAF53_2]|jgi:chemotaxis protein CheD|uniref:chemotaxis protein CheD n=1 Tax=unclassified Pseudoduganella TaxID=2637179 RepID=UPI003F977E31
MPLDEVIDIYLLPGEFFVGDARHRIRTLLGSCVSITLWHPARRIGAMSHFLVSERGKRQLAQLSGRYGAEAMELMVNELQAHGVPAHDCQGKIFGGSVMFPKIERRGLHAIGRRNGEAAERLLARYRIPVVSRSLFGVGPRLIVFEVATGDVWVRQGEA